MEARITTRHRRHPEINKEVKRDTTEQPRCGGRRCEEKEEVDSLLTGARLDFLPERCGASSR